MIPMTAQTFERIAPRIRSSFAAELAAVADQILNKWGINSDPDVLAIFWGQMVHETQGLRTLRENMRYSSATRIIQVFGSGRAGRKRFPRGAADARKYVNNPVALASYVYANRMGNGAPGTEDGWKYRGGGIIHHTGRDQFNRLQKVVGVELIKNPDRVEIAAVALIGACWYFTTEKRGGGTAMDAARAGDIKAVTKIINGGYNGLDDRIELTKSFREVFSTLPVVEVQEAEQGDTGEHIRLAQEKLSQNGHDLKPDGEFGPKTQRALLEFQSRATITDGEGAEMETLPVEITGKLDLPTLLVLGLVTASAAILGYMGFKKYLKKAAPEKAPKSVRKLKTPKTRGKKAPKTKRAKKMPKVVL